MIKIKYLLVLLSVMLYTSAANASNDPFDWPLGDLFPKTLYQHESAGGHTIARHWDKSYTYLNNRCADDSPSRPGTYSTWRRKNTAYDRMKRTWRRSESSMLVLVTSPIERQAVYRSTLFQSNEFGKLLRCSLPALVRAVDYWASGTKKTRLYVAHGRGKVRLISGFPAY